MHLRLKVCEIYMWALNRESNGNGPDFLGHRWLFAHSPKSCTDQIYHPCFHRETDKSGCQIFSVTVDCLNIELALMNNEVKITES